MYLLSNLFDFCFNSFEIRIYLYMQIFHCPLPVPPELPHPCFQRVKAGDEVCRRFRGSFKLLMLIVSFTSGHGKRNSIYLHIVVEKTGYFCGCTSLILKPTPHDHVAKIYLTMSKQSRRNSGTQPLSVDEASAAISRVSHSRLM